MSDSYYILLIDDDVEVLGTLSRTLRRAGLEVKQASSGGEGLKVIQQRMPDLVILDIVMPGMDGLEVCKTLRSDETYHSVPILFLSARGHTDEIIEGLDVGGDDYITKPFESAELLARIRALLRRAKHDISAKAVLEIGGLRLNSNTHQVDLMNEHTIQLTATEHRLLRYMMENVNQALAPGHLLQAVWSYPPDTGDPDLVRAHVRNLRSKLEPNNDIPRYIQTIHGVGYMITDQPNHV